jgi:hypothetical protein
MSRYMYRIRPLYRGVVYRGYSLPQASAEDDPVPDGFGVYARSQVSPSLEDYGFDPSGRIGGPFVDIRRDPWRIRPDLECTMTYSSFPRCDPARGFIDRLAEDSQPGGAPQCVSQPDHVFTPTPRGLTSLCPQACDAGQGFVSATLPYNGTCEVSCRGGCLIALQGLTPPMACHAETRADDDHRAVRGPHGSPFFVTIRDSESRIPSDQRTGTVLR